MDETPEFPVESGGGGIRPVELSLMAISDRRSLPAEDLHGWFAALAQARVPMVQLREKDLCDRDLLELAAAARRALPATTRLLVNARADVAIAAGADGVHLPAAGLPVAKLRQRFGRRLLVGCSTHSLEEVLAARDGGADFVTFGPVFATPSKARYGPPLGLTGLRQVTSLGIPVLALGGMTPDRFDAAAAAGAHGAAGIRLAQPVSSGATGVGLSYPDLAQALDRVVLCARTAFGAQPHSILHSPSSFGIFP